jgi:hypothetical protein
MYTVYTYQYLSPQVLKDDLLCLCHHLSSVCLVSLHHQDLHSTLCGNFPRRNFDSACLCLC